MAQTQILASGTTSATSTDVVLAADAVANIIGFTTNTDWAFYDKLFVFIDTNGDDQLIATLTPSLRGITVQGPGTFRVKRPPVTLALGATSET